MERLLLTLGLLASLAFGVPAKATILFAGGEDIDFTTSGTVTISTNTAHFRSAYARESQEISGTTADPATNRLIVPSFANQTTIWVHAETFPSAATTTSAAQAIGIYGSDGVRRILVRGTGTIGQVKISTRTTAGVITDLVTCTSAQWPTSAVLSKIDFFVNYAVSGEVTFYLNGVSLCDYTGDVTTNSVTAVNQVDFAGPASGGLIDWSEIIVSDGDTRGMNLATLAPVAAGNTQAWSGVVGNINPTTINDANVISTASNSQISEWTIPTLPSGSFTVPAVIQVARGLKGASGPTNFDYIARPGSGSSDNASADVPLQTSATNYAQHIWATNPNCSCGWVTSDLGSGTNFGIESKP